MSWLSRAASQKQAVLPESEASSCFHPPDVTHIIIIVPASAIFSPQELFIDALDESGELKL